MNIYSYFKDVNAQKQIDKLAKKYKNKKIVIYGAGEYFDILNQNYDLSKLNIVAISDKKFETSADSNTTPYKAITPDELKQFDYDVILVALLKDIEICDWLEYKFLIGTKNQYKKIRPLIEPTLALGIKMLFGKNYD